MWLNSMAELRRLYPPRAQAAINPMRLEQFKGFVAQFKYNDIRTLFHFGPDGELELLTRQREPVREYSMTPKMRKAFGKLGLDPENYHCLDGGILRHLAIAGERPIVLWDILVHNGNYLVGTTYRFRYELLRSICGTPKSFETASKHEIGLVIADSLWLAPILSGDLEEKFRECAPLDYLEGLMLKNPSARLEPGLHERNNTRWQVKVRKPRIDYAY